MKTSLLFLLSYQQPDENGWAAPMTLAVPVEDPQLKLRLQDEALVSVRAVWAIDEGVLVVEELSAVRALQVAGLAE